MKKYLLFTLSLLTFTHAMKAWKKGLHAKQQNSLGRIVRLQCLNT